MGKRQEPTQPDFIKWLLLAGVAALVAFGGYYVYIHYLRSHSAMVDRFRYPIAGIDVSKHNGNIDYNQVVADNYQFAFIKAQGYLEGPRCEELLGYMAIFACRNPWLCTGFYCCDLFDELCR